MAAIVSFLNRGSLDPCAPRIPSPAPSLERGRLHEVHCAGEDRATALAFALAMAGRGDGEAIFLIRTKEQRRGASILSGDALVLLGVDPSLVTIVETGGAVDTLRAGLDAARCPGVATIIIESEGRFADYDLTASRRLVLAAEASRTGIVILRCDAELRSSGAHTRWSVVSAPSVPMEADAPGLPSLDAHLLRRRGGTAGGRWRLIWDAEDGRFRDAARPEAMPGAVVSFPPLRKGAAGGSE
jgi:protein ImuA